MKAKFLFLLIASMFAVPGMLLAQDEGETRVEGSFSVGGIGSGLTSQDSSKAGEYRDLSDGAFGVFEYRSRSSRFFHDGYGENLGRDDMFIQFRGGMYNEFKYSVRGDWLTHNFGFGPDGARTPYINSGASNLTLFSNVPAELANSTVAPWRSFDYAIKRRNIGGTFEFSHGSPWYFLLETDQAKQDGISNYAVALGTSPGNGFTDVLYPVDYRTYNVLLEGGYQTPRGHASVSVLQSDFENDHSLLNFQNPFFGFGTDTATFAPDNYYVRIGANGMLRQLFWNSTLSGRVTFDQVTDSQDMIGAVLNTAASDVLSPTNPSAPTFEGKVRNVTATASLASVPTRKLDTRTYYRYYRRSNRSTDVVFNTTVSGLACFEEGITSPENINVPCAGHFYEYTKHNPGVEAGYRLTTDNRISSGFDFLHTQRNRFDSNKTRESKVFVQWSNTSFETITARLRYQFLNRSSEFLIENAGFNANSPFFLERFVRSFDVANVNQHMVKAYMDWTPVEFLDFGLEIYYKRNNFKDLTLGRLNDRRKEIYASISYGDPSKYRVTLFGDVEFINYDSFHRTVNAGTCPETAPNCFDPFTPATRTAFNWASQLKDKNWTVEFATEWFITPTITFRGSAIIQQTRGSVDFQSQTLDDGTPAAVLFPITSYDDTTRRSVHPRIIYALPRGMELTVGYAFENYSYSDDQYNGYQYTIGTGPTTSFLTGIYAFPRYRADVGYGTIRYSF